MLKELLNIGAFPDLALQPNQPWVDKLLTLFKTYGLILLSLLMAAPIMLFAEYFVTHILHFKGFSEQSHISLQQLFKKTGYLKAMIYICLIGPAIEETIFRLPLSFKRVHIALSFAFAVFLFSSLLPLVKHLNQSIGIWYELLIRLAVVGLIFLLIYKLLPNNLSLKPALKKALIIASICLFGLMHISNFSPLQWAIIWVYPIYVLPQLLMGVALSYMRFKNGFVWGIALHCLINSVATSLAFNHPKPEKTQHTEKPTIRKS
jgi:hypothetical protein